MICQKFSTFFLIMSLTETSFMKTCREKDNWLSNKHLNNISKAVTTPTDLEQTRGAPKIFF